MSVPSSRRMVVPGDYDSDIYKTGAVVVSSVSDLRTALSNIVGSQRILILPGKYDLGITGLNIGTIGVTISETIIEGIGFPSGGGTSGVSIIYSGSGSALTWFGTSAGETVIRNLDIRNSGTLQTGSIGINISGSLSFQYVENLFIYNFDIGIKH